MTVKIIKNILSAEQVSEILSIAADAPWENGKDTAHGIAKDAKNNHQLNKPSPQLSAIQKIIVESVRKSQAVENLAMPVRMTAPFLNKHGAGDGYGRHVDRGYRVLQPSNTRIRTDISATLALTGKGEYDGGELVVYDGDSKVSVKMEAGEIVLYPANFIHEVKPVTSGVRICACFWVQSMVRDADKRAILSDIHSIIFNLTKNQNPEETQLLASKAYQNLIRQWGET